MEGMRAVQAHAAAETGPVSHSVPLNSTGLKTTEELQVLESLV